MDSEKPLKLIKNVRHYATNNMVDILLGGRKIIMIEPKINNMPEALLSIIDGQGMTAMPGYFDQHVHITGGGGEGGFINKVPELTLSTIIKAGITSMVGLLGTDGITRSVENLVAKATALSQEGISTWCLTGSYAYPSNTLTGSVTRDIAFIDKIIGVKVAISDHRSSQMTVEELIRLAAEARLGGVISGKSGIVHLHTGRGKSGLKLVFDAIEQSDIPISVFRPTHLGKCFDDAIRFAKMGGYIDFTAGNIDKTAELVAAAMQQVPRHLITLSSDGNGSVPIWNEHKEMIGMGIGSVDGLHKTVIKLVKTYGLSLEQAASICTVNPSTALGFEKSKGRLEEGYDADILLLDNQLEIHSVFAKGTAFMLDKRTITKGRFEE